MVRGETKALFEDAPVIEDENLEFDLRSNCTRDVFDFCQGKAAWQNDAPYSQRMEEMDSSRIQRSRNGTEMQSTRQFQFRQFQDQGRIGHDQPIHAGLFDVATGEVEHERQLAGRVALSV